MVPNELIAQPVAYHSGELAGSATAAQMPDVPCRMVMFKAKQDNSGQVYIGVAGVTVADNTTDTTTGLELNAKEMTPWLPCQNLNQFFYIGSTANQRLQYLVLE